MHGHISTIQANTLSSYYAAAAAEKAAEAQRALEVRRKLLGQSIPLEEDRFRVSGESHEQQDASSRRPPRRNLAEGESAEDFAEAEPISIWA